MPNSAGHETPARPLSLRKVWSMTGDLHAAQAMRSILHNGEGFELCGIAGTLPELTSALDREAVPVAVVDIDAQPARLLKDLENIIARHAGTRFIVVCSQFANDLILQAMGVGARHFIPKQAMEADLAQVVRRLTPGIMPSRDDQRGVVISVLSAGGGCGATTLAVNLANELQILTGSPSLLIDMDYAYGSVATYLGISGEYGVSDVLARAGGIDAQLIRSTAVAVEGGLACLLSPASVDMARGPLPMRNRIEDMLEACTRRYAYTVIDAPRVAMDLLVRLAHESGRVLIVGQLSVKDIRMARAMRSIFVEAGIPPSVIRFVAGRYTRQSALSMDDVQRALGRADVLKVHNDFKAASHSINVGQLLARAAPRSALRGDIEQLASEVHSKFQASAPAHAIAGG